MTPVNSEKPNIATMNEKAKLSRLQGIPDTVSAYQPLTLRSMFWRPQYVEASAWQLHVPFAFWLIDALRPTSLVQLGMSDGTSYFAFCQAIDRLSLHADCYAVDTWLQTAQPDARESVLRNIKSTNDHYYAGFSRLMQSSYNEAANSFVDGSVDLLHIENISNPDAARAVFDMWLPKLSEHAVVLLHGTRLKDGSVEIAKLFAELMQKYPAFEFPIGNGLGILSVGGKHNELIKLFFSSSEQESAKQAVWEVFSRLGRACVDSFNAVERDECINLLKIEVQKHKSHSESLTALLEQADITTREISQRDNSISEKKSNLKEHHNKNLIEKYEKFIASLVNEFPALNLESLPNGISSSSDTLQCTAVRDTFDSCAPKLLKYLIELKADLNLKRLEYTRYTSEIAQLSKLYFTMTQEVQVEKKLVEEIRTSLSDVQDELRDAEQRLQSQENNYHLSIAEHTIELEKIIGIDSSNFENRESAEADDKRLTVAIKKLSNLLRASRKKIEEHIEQADTLSEMLVLSSNEKDDVNKRLHTLQAELNGERKDIESIIQQRNNTISSLKSENDKLRGNLAERNTELARLAQIVAKIKKSDNKMQLIETDTTAAVDENSNVNLLLDIIRNSGTFDEAWYVAQNQDVAQSRTDPLRHYLLYGASEGRDPSPSFSTIEYLKRFPELLDSKINPLVHNIYVTNRARGTNLVIGIIE